MATSVRSKIADAIVASLQTIGDLKLVTFDEVKIEAGDFKDYEIPAVQCYDLQEIVTHEVQRKKADWNLVIEVIIGPDGVSSTPTQKTLFDLMQTIEQTLWATPNLGLKEVIHMKLLQSSTDLHLLAPFYLGRIELSVMYYQPLVGDC